MKHLITCLFILTTLLHTSAKGAKPLIPFNGYHFQASTLVAKEGQKFLIQLLIYKNGDSKKISLGVGHRDFDGLSGHFEPNEVKAIIDGGKALLQKKKFRKEIVKKDEFYDKIETVFEVIKLKDGSRALRIRRFNQETNLTAKDISFLADAYAETQQAKNWYEKIIVAEKRPKETPNAKPPKVIFYEFTISLGSVKAGSLDYELSILMTGKGDEEILFKKVYLVTYKKNGKVAAIGGWLDETPEKMELAAAAIKRDEEYLYRGKDLMIAANLKTKKVDVSIDVSDAGVVRGVVTGSFDIAQVKQIQANVKKYDSRKKWLEENIGLFVK